MKKNPPIAERGDKQVLPSGCRQLPPWLEQLIDSCPTAGAGVHSWIFKVARQLHAHMPAAQIAALLRDKVSTCGRRVPDRELLQAVQNAIGCAWVPSGSVKTAPTAPTWPPVNQERRAAIVRDGPMLVDLWELSPIRVEDGRTEEIIDQLFPGDPLLCCGRSATDFDTKSREAWRGQLAGLSFIVPSPMTAIEGVTRDGRPSKHTLSNTGPRRFLVVEFDDGTTDEHAAILHHLSQYAPFVMAVHSGGKSLHGWFAATFDDERLRKFFCYAVSLGADHATWTRSQFVRIPDGTRNTTGQRQSTFYFDPESIPK